MKPLFAFTFLVLLSIHSMAQLQEEELELKSKPASLFGTLLTPDSCNGVVVLIIPGSGPTDRNGNTTGATGNNSLRYLAEDLANYGYASLRIDKRGAGKSLSAMKVESELVFDDYIEDVINWGYKVLNDVRFKKLVVLGHSEGSLVGMKAVQELEIDLDVMAYVSLAGAGFPIDEVILKQLKTMPDSLQEEAKMLFAKMKKGEESTVVHPQLMALFRPSIQNYMISWVALNPQSEIQKVQAPVLILNGTTDIQVPVENADVLYKAKPEAQLNIIEGMNHVLKTAPAERSANLKTYSQPDLKNTPELIKVLVAFLNKQN